MKQLSYFNSKNLKIGVISNSIGDLIKWKACMVLLEISLVKMGFGNAGKRRYGLSTWRFHKNLNSAH